MTMIKFKPTNSRDLLRDSVIPGHMQHLIDSMFNDVPVRSLRNSFHPRVDILENATSFEVQVSLPGLKKEEITIHVEKDALTISGERKLKSENPEDKRHLVENFYGKFSRTFTLPENVDKQNIQAELTDGILKLQLIKAEVKDNKTTINIK